MREDEKLNGSVRRELLGVRYPTGSCCGRTELEALLGTLSPRRHGGAWSVRTTDVVLGQRLLGLCRNVLGRHHPVRIHQEPSATAGRHRIELSIGSEPWPEGLPAVPTAAGLLDHALESASRRRCCAQALLRALAWRGSYLSSPRSGFHLEIVLPPSVPATTVEPLLERLDLTMATTTRRGRDLLYAKGSEAILAVLATLGATRTNLLLQDVVITKELKNDVNRGVNCELSNLRRSGASAAADLAAIRHLRRSARLPRLPEGLRAVAEARSRHPSLNLTELGRCLDPPLTKAGVFHRLRQLRQEADYERNPSS